MLNTVWRPCGLLISSGCRKYISKIKKKNKKKQTVLQCLDTIEPHTCVAFVVGILFYIDTKYRWRSSTLDMALIHLCLHQSVCCWKRLSIWSAGVQFGTTLMLRDDLVRYWPEWCHIVTVAVCKGEKNRLLAQVQTMLTRTFRSETCLGIYLWFCCFSSSDHCSHWCCHFLGWEKKERVFHKAVI